MSLRDRIAVSRISWLTRYYVWRHRVGIAFAVLAISNAAAFAIAAHVRSRADHEIAASRIAAVYQTCLQFNDVQRIATFNARVLRRLLIVVSPMLDGRLRGVFRASIGQLDSNIYSLRPNDCEGMRITLTRALATNNFSRAVPYAPARKGKR